MDWLASFVSASLQRGRGVLRPKSVPAAISWAAVEIVSNWAATEPSTI